MMQRVGEFLEAYRSRLFGAEERRRHVREAIAAVAGIAVEEKRIAFRQGTCVINAPAAVKNEIFFRKQALLGECARRGVKISDIC